MSNLKESATQAKAFIFYFELGDDRSIEAVANEFGKTKKTIYKWSHTYRWKERCALKQQEINEKLLEHHVDLIVNMNADFLHLINKSMAIFSTNLHAGNVEVKTVLDFKNLVEMFKKVAGEPEKIEVNSTVNSTSTITEQDKETFDNLTNAILSLKKGKEEEEEE